ncbi:MAG: UTP--glucose-1-phosphate uridylyltransferase [Moraxellaceae bacterium]|nr:UTP--glucose-1-phosphate uridylyltransferase [Moraxellaceae bacterium]
MNGCPQALPVEVAVLPMAGRGGALMPATRVVPKELLPVANVPLVQRAVAEAAMAGVREVILVTSPDKPLVGEHFQPDPGLEQRLQDWGQSRILQAYRAIVPAGVTLRVVEQPVPRGLGDAILCARALVGNRHFAVILPDDVIDMPAPGCLAAMVRVHRETGASVLGVQPVPATDVSRYGMVKIVDGRITDLVEKPAPAMAPGNMAVMGRYILSPRVFEALMQIAPGANGEYQLSDAICLLMQNEPFVPWEITAPRYDCGSRLGFAQATIALSLHDPDIGPALRAWLTSEVTLE